MVLIDITPENVVALNEEYDWTQKFGIPMEDLIRLVTDKQAEGTPFQVYISAEE